MQTRRRSREPGTRKRSPALAGRLGGLAAWRLRKREDVRGAEVRAGDEVRRRLPATRNLTLASAT